MLTQVDHRLFKKILVLFWFLWWLIALWTDVVGGFAAMGVLHASWAPDGNYPFLVQSLKMYPLFNAAPIFFYVAILFCSLLSTILFAWASFGLRFDDTIWMRRAQCAFIVSLTYWLAFFIADQMVMKFDLEQNHMVQGGFELLTYLAFYMPAHFRNNETTFH